MFAKIADVRVAVFETLARATADSEGHLHPGADRQVEAALLTVTDSDGCVGHSLTSPEVVNKAVLVGHVVPVLEGSDAFERERIWQHLARRQRLADAGLSDRALCAVDLALWDLVGRKVDVAVWRLLGGARSKVLAYGSTMCGDEIEGGLATPADYARFAVQLVDQGYRGIKLHSWMPPVSFAPSPAMDVKACTAVRNAVGPDIALMLDCHHWYSRQEARWVGKAIQELGFTWFEEPMDEYSLSSYRWLADQLDIAVIGPESAAGKHHTRAEWIRAEACDILRIGVERGGGLSPSLKAMHLAESFGMTCEVHRWGTGSLALIGATTNSRWYERGLLHPHVDRDAPPPHLHSLPDPMDADGYVFMPDGPGLGDDLNLDYINAHTVACW